MRVPVVSIILPAYNAAGTLACAVDSIRCQTLTHWELMIADDGSTDRTLELARAIEAKEPRLRILSLPHSGIVPVLNAALAAAQAPLIARMDADDWAYPDRLEQQVFWLRDHPELGLASSLVEFGGDRSRARGYALHVDWINTLVTPEAISLNRFVEAPFAHPSVMFRRELVERHGGYREGDFPEDYELWLRWLDAGVRMSKVPRALLTWNDSPERLSRQDARYATDAFYRCKAFYLARWLKQQVEPTRSVLVWGAGRPTRKRADHLVAHGIRISGYIDIDPRKVGRSLSGRKVISPGDIPRSEDCFVLCYVAKRDARELARNHLGGRGFVEGRDFLMAA